MKKRILLSLLLFSCVSLFAQKDKRLANGLSPLNEVPQMLMPAQDNHRLQTEEAARRNYETAPRYAVNLSVDINPENSGKWETSPDGKQVWRLLIKSPTAYSINLGFSQYKMPAGGQLFLYSPDYSQVMGPFTPADNEEHEQLWTPILQGDELIIEVQLPAIQRAALNLELSYVNHAFQNFSALISGSCNLDVICGAADGFGIVDGYRDIIQSVAVISTGGGTFCTGFLVNNVQNDCTPFFMTADHCGINSGNAASLVTYWNFQNSTCRQPNSPLSGTPGDGQLTDFNTGAIFRAARSNSDFTLVELDDPISPTANAFFAGWDATASSISSAVGVHHPNTDEKRISFDNDPLQFTSYGGTTPITGFDHVRVIDWNIGTTEPGSSGSPLFDQNKRIVGQLHGGGAACGNNSSDWYGAFATSWDAGSAAATRLKDWLDPNNTGTLVINGRYASSCTFSVIATPAMVTVCTPLDAVYNLEVSEAFSSTVVLSTSNLPTGASANFSSSSVSPGGTTTLIITTDGVTPGSYTVTINATDGSNTSQDEIIVLVLDGTNATPVLTSPANNSTDVFPNPPLSWEGDDSGATTYEIEIATNSDFSAIVETANTTNTSYRSTNANDGLTTYYWHVKAINPCGTSAFSSTYQFFTSNIDCVMYSSETSTTISDVGTPFIENDIFVNNDNEIAAINVALNVTHTYVGDLDATLLAPDGNSILLFDRPDFPNSDFGCSEDNLLLLFSENSSNDAASLENTCHLSNGPDSYAIEGNFQPIGNFNSLSGSSSLGLWTLQMNDNATADGGVLESWSITICHTIEGSPPSIVTNNLLEVPRGSEENITADYLEITDNESLPSALVFTLQNLPTQGDLLLNNTVLNQGATFTQQDINNGLLRYKHNGGIILNDEFEFDVTDESGFMLTNNIFSIQITLSPMNASLQLTGVSLCHGDMDASLTVIVSGGLPPYEYSLNNADFQVPNTYDNLGAGDYIVTVRDDLGDITNSSVFSISEPAALSATSSVNENQVTVVAGGGIMPYSYQLNNDTPQADNTFSNLPNGLYTITIIDANGCETMTNATIAVNTLNVNASLINNISCHNANDASISIGVQGGTTPYEYQLNDGIYQSGNTFSNLGADTYQVTVRDAEDFLMTTSEIIINNPPLLTISATVAINTITATANGGTPPLMFSINGGNTQTDGVFNELPNGIYTVAVIDANGCITTTDVTVAVNTLSVNATVTNDISCHNATDAAISVNVEGGTAPFEYKLDEGAYQNENIFSNLGAGTYQITVRDAEGFLFTITEIIVTNPPLLTISASSTMNNITATASGGTPPLSYSLNDGETQESSEFNDLANGIYTITVIDANGCTATIMASVSFSDLSVNLVLLGDIDCHNDNNGRIQAQVEGGIAPFEYSLDGENYQDNALFSNLEAGDYIVWIRDAEGFIQTSNAVTVTNPPVIMIESIIIGSTITVMVTGGTGAIMYNIDGGDYQNDNVFENVEAGSHFIRVVDENNCIETDVVVVDLLRIDELLINNITCIGANDGNLLVNIMGGAMPYEYSLDGENFQTSSYFDNLVPGSYRITIRDAVGTMITTDLVSIMNPIELTMDLQLVADVLFVEAMGGTGSYMYSINGIDYQNQPQFGGLEPGEQEVWLQDANGCIISDTITIIVSIFEPFKPSLSFQLFPNPNQGQFQLQMNQETAQKLQCYIYNIAGEIVFQQTFEKRSGLFQVNFKLDFLVAGMYEIILTDGYLLGTSRVIVQ